MLTEKRTGYDVLLLSLFIHTERKITTLSLAFCMILHSGKDYTTLMSSVFCHLNSRIFKSISNAVAQWLRCCATIGRSLVRSQLVSLEFFIDIKSSDRTMALGSTQPLTEMSTRSISWGVKAAGA